MFVNPNIFYKLHYEFNKYIVQHAVKHTAENTVVLSRNIITSNHYIAKPAACSVCGRDTI